MPIIKKITVRLYLYFSFKLLTPFQYNFNWKVSDKDTKPDGNFFEHMEKADEANPERVEGEFRTWLPDGRLKIVKYYVDKDSGFVPTITYEDNHKPAFRRK